jgi:hypothetical protein
MSKKLFISSIVATILLGTSPLMANEDSAINKESAKVQQLTVSKEVKKQKEAFQEAPKEIVEGFNQTLIAITALENNKTKEAKSALKSATKSFNKALKADPALDIVPFEQEIVVNEFLGSSASVEKALELATTMIDNHDTQSARAVMMPLEDEMIITTHLIPMKLYPVATEEALKDLEAGKTVEALDILHTSFNTLVTERVLIPLPLLVAEDLVAEASFLDKAKKEDALKLLSLAQDELQKALYLGYTKEHSPAYKALEDEIESIKKEIKGKNVVEKLYDKIKESFTSLISDSKKDSKEDNKSK